MEKTVIRITRYVALGALFLIPFVPALVTQDATTLFGESHGFGSFVALLVFLVRLPFFMFGSLGNYFFPFITDKAFVFRILVEIAFAAWIVLAALDKRYRPYASWVSYIVVAFVVWMFVADLFAVNVLKAFWSNFERMEGWILLVHLLGFFIAASAIFRVEEKGRMWFLVSIGVSVLLILYALAQLTGGLSIHQGYARVDATFGNSAYFGVYLLFNTFIASWLALTEKQEWLKRSLFVVAGLEAICIFLTGTRGSVIGLFGALILVALGAALSSKGKGRRYGLIALASVVLVMGGLFALRNTSFVKNTYVLDRVATLSISDGQTRFQIWHTAWIGFLDKPVTGWGQEGFNYVFNKYYDPKMYHQEPWFDRAHNAFIDWLIAGGLPAFVLYLALFGCAFFFLWRGPFSKAERYMLTAALLGYGFHNLFVFDNLYSYVYFFAILAFIDGRVGKPVPLFMRFGELKQDAAVAFPPFVAALALAAIFFVNVPGMKVASGLITALTPQADLSQNLATFEDLASRNSFATQEVREQIVSFAGSLAGSQSVPNTVKAQFAELAVSEMKKQIAEHPGDTREYLQLALGYRVGGDLKSSLAALIEGVQLSPKKQQMLIQVGATYLDLQDYEDAKKAFEYAYALSPQFVDLGAYAAAGEILTGERDTARKTLLTAFGTTTVDSDILALAYYNTHDYVSLASMWQLRLANNNSLQTYYGLASAYYIGGNMRKAGETLQQALIAHPESQDEIKNAYAQLIQATTQSAGKK